MADGSNTLARAATEPLPRPTDEPEKTSTESDRARQKVGQEAVQDRRHLLLSIQLLAGAAAARASLPLKHPASPISLSIPSSAVKHRITNEPDADGAKEIYSHN